jgi:release factor glutamine methyltransferase
MLRDALNRAAAQLQAAGIERSRFEARLLLGQALDLSTEAIIADDSRPLSAGQLRAITALVARRAAREPMAQILGWREFYGRRFAVTADVLTPRPDSETVIEAALQHFPDPAAELRILDLGTGTGSLLLTLLAERPAASGLGIDKSSAALAIARANAQALDLAARVELRPGDWSQPGWDSGLADRFDLVVANPPYIPRADLAGLAPEVRQYEPHLALDGGPDGLDAYRLLAVPIKTLLARTGLAVLEVGLGQAEAVGEILRQAGLNPLSPRQDLAGIPRCVLAALP